MVEQISNTGITPEIDPDSACREVPNLRTPLLEF